MNEPEAALARLRDSLAAYLKASEAGMDAEMQRSSETFHRFKPHKIGRYCFPLRWSEIEKSANHALDQWFESLTQDITRKSAHVSDLAYQKALAKFNARCGKTPPHEVLWGAVKNNEDSFLRDLRECHEETGRVFQNGNMPWHLFVIIFWTRPLPLPDKEWPLCFWSDKALVSFFEHSKAAIGADGSDCTLDKWRKFKRMYKLKRPDYLVVRGFKRTEDYNGKLIGYELRYKPITSDKSGPRALEGGEQSTH